MTTFETVFVIVAILLGYGAAWLWCHLFHIH